MTGLARLLPWNERMTLPTTLSALLCALSVACAQHPQGSPSASPPGDTVPSADSNRPGAARPAGADTIPTEEDPADYEGVNSRGIPHYATAYPFTAETADLLRRAYGIEDPHRLYVSDSTDEKLLKYDTQVKRCLSCYVNSYRIGYVSVRRPGESWDEAERRVRAMPPSAFAHGPHAASSSLDDLDPDVQPLAERMLRDARAAGFRLRVTATYRSPVREAFLMAEGRGRTHTLTSNHSYGRALDIVIDDGDRRHPQTRRDWIAFRRWVTHYRTPAGEAFRILGQLDRSWDWAHIDVPSSQLGFDDIDQAIARAKACLAQHASIPCNFQPHLPERLRETLVQ